MPEWISVPEVRRADASIASEAEISSLLSVFLVGTGERLLNVVAADTEARTIVIWEPCLKRAVRVYNVDVEFRCRPQDLVRVRSHFFKGAAK